MLGDIYHSTPRVVGAPQEFLRDESYTAFAASRLARPLMLYTSTNDGFLHAFKVAPGSTTDTFKVDKLENNEIWAFMPPALLPKVPAQYPGTHQELLDGVPVVRDVVATKVGTEFVLERSQANAANPDANTTWRTILIQSFGGASPGYFALDITDPVPSQTGGGPKFLWQITTDKDGNPLFGRSGPTPLITTLFLSSGTGPAKEVAVAVLPGGDAGPSGSSCTRQTTSFADIDSAFPPRNRVHCYSPNSGPARSLTVVRLDTGEIIRTFRQTAADAPAGLAAKVTESPLDSPITGQPVAFPGETGSIADRIFVGDRDGALWRLDVSDSDPSKWTLKLFFDGYPAAGNAYDSGEPIATRPIVSVDALGQVTVAFSTGDQEVLTADPTMSTYIWSITEVLDATGTKFQSKANWYTKLTGGERVAGPMSLFNGALYFSSFAPESASGGNVCKAGSSRVWGVDYLIPTQKTDLSKGGLARLPEDPNASPVTLVQFIDNSSSLVDDGAVIFGVGIAQLPTCAEETTSAGSNDYLGHGTLSHTSLSRTNPGKFQLVMHTGNKGASPLGGQTKTVSFDLAEPPASAFFDGWAALVE